MFKNFKQSASDLRLNGYTYSEISTKLGVKIPKSTLSDWFKNLKYTEHQKAKLQNNIKRKLVKAQTAGLSSIKKNRISMLSKLYNSLDTDIGNIDRNMQKIVLSILYLGEGAKYKSTKDLRLTNSDPEIIKLYLKLLFNLYDIDTSKLRVRIQSRFDQDSDMLIKYWRRIINIEGIRFYPTYVDKRTSNSKTRKRNYMGVCSIFYFDTSIQIEIEMLSRILINKLTNRKQSANSLIRRWYK